jgi:hypothetical protein
MSLHFKVIYYIVANGNRFARLVLVEDAPHKIALKEFAKKMDVLINFSSA